MSKQSNTVTVMQASELSKLIGAIGRKANTLATDIQTAAVQCIAQSIVHRNATPAQQLYEALNTSVRRDSLVKFFELWGNLAWSKTEKKVIFFDVKKVLDRKIDWTEEYAAKVSAMHWSVAVKPPQPVSQYDVSEEIDKLLERLHKAQKKGASLAHADLLLTIEQAYNKYQFEAFSKTTKVSQKDENASEETQKQIAADHEAAQQEDAERSAQQTGEVGEFPAQPELQKVA